VIVALTICSVLGGLCEAAILATVAQTGSALVYGGRTIHADLGSVHLTVTVRLLLTIGFGLAALRMALQFPLTLLPARISSDVQATMQRRLFSAYAGASWAEKSREREGYLQELITSQALQAAYGALSVTGFITTAITLVVLLASAFLLNPLAALVVSVVAILLLSSLRPISRAALRRARGLSQAQMDLASNVGEAARMAEETDAFGVTGAQGARIDGAVSTARRFLYEAQVLSRIGPSTYQSILYALVLAGLALISAGHSHHVAALGAVVLLLLRVGSYAQGLQSAYQNLRQSLPFIERVEEAETRYLANVPVTGSRPLPRIAVLGFDHVSYAYTADRPVLRDLTFEVAAGETIGVIGPSGAGKSTLIQLLLRLRIPDSGRYLVNDHPASEFSSTDWHARVAYVPQAPKLLHASVADNIRYFRDIPDEAVTEAGRLARIDDDIMSWPHGYATIVGPRADAISGGQQQRICIARALAGNPELLILDEPTSALDPRSESLLQESLASLKERLTLFVIAHRMSTLEICDRVMVIVDGRIEAFDTAGGLNRENAYYQFASVLSRGGAVE
jgi:ABC-type multidrug transport system fused ATPase/permease subunit